MTSVLRALKDRRVRASATSAVATSAGIPDSGLVFVNNSQGASAAIAELSGLLGDALEMVEINGDEPRDDLKFQLSQLDAEAAKYINSRLDETKCRSWTCGPADATLVNIAAQCAVAAYDSQIKPEVDGFRLERQLYQPSSQTDIEKASLFTLAQPIDDSVGRGTFPLLILSIRGTATVIDHLVNLNAVPEDAQAFINLSHFHRSGSNSTIERPTTVEAHAGFLDSARSVREEAARQIQTAITQKAVQHVLFTGHSAGGAVASLLFLHFLCNADTAYTSCRFSSITFGSPPALTQDLTPLVLGDDASADRRGLVLNFANEYDLVPRASRGYVRSLVDLYRSIYRLPRIQDQSTADYDRRALCDLTINDKEAWQRIGRRQQGPLAWGLPPTDSFHIGKIVVLKAGYANGHEKEEEEVKAGSGGQDRDSAAVQDLRAYAIRPGEFAKLLFCRISVHTRQIYLENVKEIAEGRLHGSPGWVQ